MGTLFILSYGESFAGLKAPDNLRSQKNEER
jgi:hypothetical protein